MTQAYIHLTRIGKPTRHFKDGLLEDNGKRLRTHAIIPERISIPWSEEWQRDGRIRAGQVIGSVWKYLFYGQHFSIMEFHATTGELLGYYIDISTPVRKEKGEYYLDDLILDLWIYPDLAYRVLDEGEWQQAVQHGFVSEEIQSRVEATLQQVIEEIHQGTFPHLYIQDLSG